MKRNIVIAAVAAAALIGGGTATALAVTGDDEDTARRTVDARASDDGAREDGDDAREGDGDRPARVDVTAPEAIAAALEHTPGTVVSAELDAEDDGNDGNDEDAGGRAAWRVDVLGGDTRHSLRIDPGTGRVLGSGTEQEDDTAGVRAALKGTSVTAAEAAEAAAGKGTVTSVDLDEEGRSAAWEVETHAAGKADREWRVAPDTGKVTADRSDDD
ncbi:PepSY domain-containing protein [Streptomyces sp. NPDC052701]|uniref:PepSY domain-containing protein n=1 Tax=Streptomyces sp. NPDC052701 TaxID=3155533 RepID=UPI003431AE42